MSTVNRRIIYKTFGESSVLEMAESLTAKPSAGNVIIKMAGAGLNPIDYKTRKGLGFVAAQIKDHLPWTPGYDVAGEIVALGEGVTRWKLGDSVFGMIGFPLAGGACAEYPQVAESDLITAPANVRLSDCAAIPLVALTAWQALFEAGNLKAGSRILIHAAAGGVGHFAVQFAKARQCHVIATASVDNHEFLLSLGADEVIDYRTEDFAARCQDIDFVLDCIGGDVGLRSIDLLAEGGQLITVPTVTAQAIVESGAIKKRHVKGLTVKPNTAQLKEIADLISSGKVRVLVARRIPLCQIAEGHDDLELGHTRGKLIVVP